MSAAATSNKRKKAPLQQARLTDLNQTPNPPRPAPATTPAKLPHPNARQASLKQFFTPVQCSNEDKENGALASVPQKRKKTPLKAPVSKPVARTLAPTETTRRPFSSADIDHDDEILCLGSQQPAGFAKTSQAQEASVASHRDQLSRVSTRSASISQARHATKSTKPPSRTSLKTVIHIDSDDTPVEDEGSAGDKARKNDGGRKVSFEKGSDTPVKPRRVVESSQWYENVDSQSVSTQHTSSLGDEPSPKRLKIQPFNSQPSVGGARSVCVGTDDDVGDGAMKKVDGNESKKSALGLKLPSPSLTATPGPTAPVDSQHTPSKASDIIPKIEWYDGLLDDLQDLDDAASDFEPLEFSIDLKKAESHSTSEGHTELGPDRTKHSTVGERATEDTSEKIDTLKSPRPHCSPPRRAEKKVIYSSDGEEDDEEEEHLESIPETQLPRLTQVTQYERYDDDEDYTPHFTFQPNALERELRQNKTLPSIVRKPLEDDEVSFSYTQDGGDGWKSQENVAVKEEEEDEEMEGTGHIQLVENSQVPETPARKKSTFSSDSPSVTFSQLLPESLMEAFPLPSSLTQSSYLEETQ